MSAGPGMLALRPAPWPASPGGHAGIALSARVRLARNLAGRAFPRKLAKARQQELVEELLAAIPAASGRADAHAWEMARLSESERQLLVERQLVSRELAAAKRPGGLWLADDESLAVMVNEEDHLRLQAFRPGDDLAGCLAAAVALDQALGQALPWAFDPALGHLTACHTNLGTGMRASVMVHLPALAETGELKRVLRGLAQLHITVRGRHGEGSEAGGHLYQISNLRSLGLTEEGIVERIAAAVARVVEAEELARAVLAGPQRARLDDRVWRAWGILTHARRLGSDELADQLGWLRLGLALGVLPDAAAGLEWRLLDRMLVSCQAAHLQLGADPAAGLDQSEIRDRHRATLVRSMLTRRDQ
jgi:protein arginine kinase